MRIIFVYSPLVRCNNMLDVCSETCQTPGEGPDSNNVSDWENWERLKLFCDCFGVLDSEVGSLLADHRLMLIKILLETVNSQSVHE